MADDLRSEDTKYLDAEIARAVARERAEIARLRAQLAEIDAMVSTHAHTLDANPRSSWPPGSILEKSVARHEARLIHEQRGDGDVNC